jgi:hypothetical protein
MVCCNSKRSCHGCCAKCKVFVASSPVSDFSDIASVVELILGPSRLRSLNFSGFSPDNLECLFACRLREVNRRWRGSFLHDNLLRFWGSLTDHNWRRGRLWTLIIFRLALISLELIRLVTTLFSDAFLDSDVGFPDVPLRFPWSTRVSLPGTIWFAPVPLVDYRSCAFALALGFADGLPLDKSLDDC